MNWKKFPYLIEYIVEYDGFRRPCFDAKLNSARLLFQNKQYDLVVSDLKRYLEISPAIILDIKISTRLTASGKIQLSVGHDFTPIFSLDNHYCLHLRKDILNNFELFCMVVVHELCHLKLFLSQKFILKGDKKIFLYAQEKAVDTLGILSGFAELYKEISPFSHNLNQEYLNKEEFDFIYYCFKEGKKFKRKDPV